MHMPPHEFTSKTRQLDPFQVLNTFNSFTVTNLQGTTNRARLKHSNNILKCAPVVKDLYIDPVERFIRNMAPHCR